MCPSRRLVSVPRRQTMLQSLLATAVVWHASNGGAEGIFLIRINSRDERRGYNPVKPNKSNMVVGSGEEPCQMHTKEPSRGPFGLSSQRLVTRNGLFFLTIVLLVNVIAVYYLTFFRVAQPRRRQMSAHVGPGISSGRGQSSPPRKGLTAGRAGSPARAGPGYAMK